VEDLFVLQSDRPQRIILSLNRKTADWLLDPARQALPFSRREIVLSLDPWFPQGDAALLKDQVEELRDLGYRAWILNNLGHFSLFRGEAETEPVLVAGPWLYSFNRHAAAFLASLGLSALITPLENNRQNLERTVTASGRGVFPGRALCFVTLYAWPALFQIRGDLSAAGFGVFSDSQGESFRLAPEAWASTVRPEKPFSIVDKRPFLEQAGFRRFILDFSGAAGSLKKKDYRRVMEAAREGSPLAGVSRFNWKDGFWSPEEPSGGPQRPRLSY
jgi:putative protease